MTKKKKSVERKSYSTLGQACKYAALTENFSMEEQKMTAEETPELEEEEMEMEMDMEAGEDAGPAS